MTFAAVERPSLGMTPPRLFAWFIGAFLLYAVPSVWLLAGYLQPAFELAIYDQSLWLIAHGETFNTIIASHVLGVHFSPILYVLSPIGLIPGGAVPELVCGSALIASGVYPAARLAETLGKRVAWFVAAYALHPAIIGGSWYGFRPWNLAVPVVLWAVYWIVRKPTGARIVAAGLVVLVFREDLAIWIGLAAVVLTLAGRIPWRSLIAPGLILGLATGVILLGLVPSLSPVDGYFFADAANAGQPAFTSSIASVVARVAFVVLPFGVLPSRLDWRLATPLVVPVLGLVLKGGNALSTAFHYDMMFVPLMLLVVGLSPRAVSGPRQVAVVSLVVMLLLGALRPFPPQDGPNPFRYDADVARQFDAALEEISDIDGHESLSLAAPSHLIPHLSERNNVFIYPEPEARPDRDQYGGLLALQCPAPNIVVTISQPSPPWDATLETDYELHATAEKVLIWRRSNTTADDPCDAVWLGD